MTDYHDESRGASDVSLDQSGLQLNWKSVFKLLGMAIGWIATAGLTGAAFYANTRYATHDEVRAGDTIIASQLNQVVSDQRESQAASVRNRKDIDAILAGAKADRELLIRIDETTKNLREDLRRISKEK